MANYFVLIIVCVMIATLAVLFVGIFTMARGGAFNQKFSNKLMRTRVLFQGIALLLFAIFMLFAGRD